MAAASNLLSGKAGNRDRKAKKTPTQATIRRSGHYWYNFPYYSTPAAKSAR
jgi:hypothetical protein